MKIGSIGAAIALALASTGCATVTEGGTQVINVSTTPIVGATCIFSNKRGEWHVVTPGAIMVKKSNSMLHGLCTKDGYAQANVFLSAESDNVSLAGMLIPYAGLVELAVDSSSGATSKYPDSYTVRMKPMADAGAAAPPSSPESPRAANPVSTPGT